MHQITAFGGRKPVPFQRAIPQSPALVPLPSNQQQENMLQQFLSLLNVSTLQEARGLPSSTLIAVNNKQILHAPYANYIYGPAVDGAFTPGIPSELLLQVSFPPLCDRYSIGFSEQCLIVTASPCLFLILLQCPTQRH